MNAPEPLEVELLASDHARRVSIQEVERFRESITTKPPADPIDELVAELREGKEPAP